MNNDTNDYNTYGTEDVQEEVQVTASSATTRRKKPRVRKKRKKKYYSLRIIVLILICVGIYFLLHSEVFTIEKIQVEENTRFSVEEVMEMSKLKNGVNMFEINTGKCEDRLEKNPYIKEADVSRKIPDTINVALELRIPVAVVKDKDKFVMIDREGFIVEIRDRMPWYTLFDGVNAVEAKAGSEVKVKEEKKYDEYMELLDIMMESDLYFRSMVIGDGQVRMYVNENLYCVGEKENVVAGMRDGNLKAVLFNLSEKGVKKGVLNIGDDQYYSFSKPSK